MMNHKKRFGTVAVTTLCAVLAAGPGLAQEDAAQAGADRDASRADAVKGNDSGISMIKPNEGLAALLRRASRNRSAPPAGLSANAGVSTPFARRGAGVSVMRNAIGAVVPGGGQGAGAIAPGFAAHPEIGANRAAPSAIGAAAAAGHLGDVNVNRPAMPLNTVAGPASYAGGINGTTMGHAAAGPGYIGGPARDRSGINGTTMRPRH